MIPKPQRYTYGEFLEITKDEMRVEFIDGQIFYLSTPTLEHQRVILNIARKMAEYFESRNSSCEPIVAPFDVVIQKEDEEEKRVQPDIFVICGEKPFSENEYKGVPSLVVEVLSPSNSNHDYVKKMDLYSRFGVNEYWIVSPLNKSIEVFILNENGYYKEPILYTKDEVIRSNLFEDLSIELKLIFR